MCEALAAGCEQPLVLPLSRKSPDGRLEASEVAAADALAWMQVGGGCREAAESGGQQHTETVGVQSKEPASQAALHAGSTSYCLPTGIHATPPLPPRAAPSLPTR